MSTRATITVRDTEHATEAYSVYRHCDGYPDTEHGVIATLRQALPYAWPLPGFEAMDFSAAIVAAWKQPARKIADNYSVQGGGIYLTTGRDAHGDTEYHYEIFQDTKGRVVVRTFASTCPDTADGEWTWKKTGRDHYLTAKMQAGVIDAQAAVAA